MPAEMAGCPALPPFSTTTDAILTEENILTNVDIEVENQNEIPSTPQGAEEMDSGKDWDLS